MTKKAPPCGADSSRRHFLQKSLSLLPLAAAGSSLLPLPSEGTIFPAREKAHYVPAFFNPEEWLFIQAATDRLIPDDEYGPGALRERVPEFIDRQMELPYGHGLLWYMQPPFTQSKPELGYQSSLVPRETYRRGIRAVEGWCLRAFNHRFAELPPHQQDTLLHQLETGDISFDDIPGTLFFTQLLENTREGYLADPKHGGNQTLASWKLIGFPGARADYPQVLDSPNKPYTAGPVSISGKQGA